MTPSPLLASSQKPQKTEIDLRLSRTRKAGRDLANVSIPYWGRIGLVRSERSGTLVRLYSWIYRSPAWSPAMYAERVLRAGARGYITKHEGGERLMQAVRHVLSGQIYVSEKMSAHILERFSGGQAAPVCSLVAQLSDREFGVLELPAKVSPLTRSPQGFGG